MQVGDRIGALRQTSAGWLSMVTAPSQPMRCGVDPSCCCLADVQHVELQQPFKYCGDGSCRRRTTWTHRSTSTGRALDQSFGKR